MIILDSSGTITSEQWDEVIVMLRLLITAIDSHSTLGVTSRVALINFASVITHEFSLDDNFNKEQILRYIDDGQIVRKGGLSFLVPVINQARDILLRDPRGYISGTIRATNAVILFTDALPSPNISAFQFFLLSTEQQRALLVLELEKLETALESLMLEGVHVNLIGKLLSL